MQKENRKRPRRRFRYLAHVAFGDGSPIRQCTLLDVSETGARITIDISDTMPAEFALLLASGGAARRWCNVVWQSGSEIGVLFVPAPMKRQTPVRLAELDV
jgi:hypothetical protein